jgi:hypothetical protein
VFTVTEHCCCSNFKKKLIYAYSHLVLKKEP